MNLLAFKIGKGQSFRAGLSAALGVCTTTEFNAEGSCEKKRRAVPGAMTGSVPWGASERARPAGRGRRSFWSYALPQGHSCGAVHSPGLPGSKGQRSPKRSPAEGRKGEGLEHDPVRKAERPGEG